MIALLKDPDAEFELITANLQKEVTSRLDPWVGLLDIDLYIDPALESVQTPRVRDLAEVIEELISNSIRHGKAKKIELKVLRSGAKDVEIVAIDEHGLRSMRFAEADPKGCLFEFVYLARPDTTINGNAVHGVRVEVGRRLAKEFPVDADVVIPVPESGTPAAVGYAQASGIPVISTNVGGVKDIVLANETGIIMKGHSEVELAKHLIELHLNRSLRMKMSQNARNFVKEKFTYQRLVDDIDSLYKTLLPNE